MINLSDFSSIFVANWKLNGNIDFINQYFKKLTPNSKNCVVICPPSIFLNRLKINNINLFSGAQDVSIFDDGPFTGEISANMLFNESIKFCLVGHSERRQHFNETNETVKKKSTKLIESKIIPIICVGETLEEKENKLTERVLSKQLEEGLSEVANDKNSIIAYEPVWAIGSGLTPSLEEIESVHVFIRKLNSKFNNFRILYGGSIKSTNSTNIKNLKNVDGCLVGGSSLKVEEFNTIIS